MKCPSGDGHTSGSLNVLPAVVTYQGEAMPIRNDYQYRGSHGFGLRCLQCGKEFEAARRDAKFCSPVCRKASARRKAQLKRAADIALQEIAFIRRQMEMYPDLKLEGQLQLDRIDQALDVTAAGRTHLTAARNVTVASVTDKQVCPKCGREVDYVSIFVNMCEDCIRKERAG